MLVRCRIVKITTFFWLWLWYESVLEDFKATISFSWMSRCYLIGRTICFFQQLKFYVLLLFSVDRIWTTVKTEISIMKEGYSVTYQKTSTHSGKANGSLEIFQFRLISKPESKEGCNFYNSASNQHVHAYEDMIFSPFF